MTKKLPKINGKLAGVIIIILFLIAVALVFQYVTSEEKFTGVIQKINYSELNYTKGSVYFVNENDSITPPVLIFNRRAENPDLKVFLEGASVTKKQVIIYYSRLDGQIVRAMYENAISDNYPYKNPSTFGGIVHDVDIPDINGIGVIHMNGYNDMGRYNYNPYDRPPSVFISDEIDANKFLIEANNTKQQIRFSYNRLATFPGYALNWLESVAAEGDSKKLVSASKDALAGIPDGLSLRAMAADHLSNAALALKDHETAMLGRWEAFRSDPCPRRLLDLWELAGLTAPPRVVPGLHRSSSCSSTPPPWATLPPTSCLSASPSLATPAWTPPALSPTTRSVWIRAAYPLASSCLNSCKLIRES